METLEGTAQSVVFAAPEGGFTVFRLRPSGRRGLVTVTANAPAPLVGQEIALSGEWVQHPRFGEQFKAATLRVSAPTSLAGIERFLASGAIAGVGEAMAHRLVQKFGKETLEIIEKKPSRLTEVAGVGKKTAAKIHASYMEKEELREIMLWLEMHGVSGAYAARIFETYSSFAIEVMEKHPYRLARDIAGIGFLTADAIAKSAGIAEDSKERIEAGLGHALLTVSQQGHCCIPAPALTERAAKLLGTPTEEVREVLKEALAAERLAFEEVGAETLIYPPWLYRAEKRTAQMLFFLQQKAAVLPAERAAAIVADWERAAGITLAAEQQQAVAAVLDHAVFVLTGGPGTGKTTVVRGMIAVLESQGLSVLLGAPTGRAAKRLAEATGRKAETVHRLLGAQGGIEADGSPVFEKDADDPLDADAIILDEVSMMDIVLMEHFLEAVPEGARVILVGDVDQLPAVGPGAVLKDILRSGAVPSVRLKEVFRQSGEGTIVLNAHAINRGRMPQFAVGGDFEFLEMPDEETAARRIVALCREELPREGFSALDAVQVLSPMHRTPCGVDNLNRLLQAALNPPAPEKAEFRNSTLTLRVGDKVMQTKNDYTKGVFNGDIGFIREVSADGVKVRYSDELTADYEPNELMMLTLAYAMSVHKSQGSEYPVIVLPLVAAHHIMLQRNLLYTAVTRAKKKVVLLGSKAAVFTAVSNDRTRRRYTLLAERLAGAGGESPLLS
ncbi:SF1B family DNA helicase RecD2 [Selenomonas sputigena]|uniref:ATP-dependent RecD2 DNA helicase n=1 Tax=Selenomonas sputigena (strain ATCC 35185 / DSM 20758 / CCUG 44933 / VPI D19B-28) TaxID=546271 RepID=C9LXY6_SELS3|nr:ATP-dependent RecD-like DNA helicase [Selenomonas sputigena]AEB99328.1 helicase, RecD/TraA family [Selenomonas sputigena ATCC 35185]EEX76180.1 helicase, RecD/TraA family [Selenomonas sputigena ATCC 35185]